MFSEGSNDEILAAWSEGNDPNAPVLAALHPANQTLREEAVPCSIQGFRAASFRSESMMVTRLESMLKCRIKMGSVQRATAPKPTNKTRF